MKTANRNIAQVKIKISAKPHQNYAKPHHQKPLRPLTRRKMEIYSVFFIFIHSCIVNRTYDFKQFTTSNKNL